MSEVEMSERSLIDTFGLVSTTNINWLPGFVWLTAFSKSSSSTQRVYNPDKVWLQQQMAACKEKNVSVVLSHAQVFKLLLDLSFGE